MDDARARELYSCFRDELARVDPKPCFAAYDTFEPGTFDFDAMVFLQLSDAQATFLTNSVNEFVSYVSQVRAWMPVLARVQEDERFDTLVAFVLPLAHAALGAPYMIKQRFCHSIAELSHQANRFARPGWKDSDISLKDPDFKLARRLARDWSMWKGLEDALSKLNSEAYRADVYDFRNEFHHGFPRQIEYGVTPFVSRQVGESSVTYAFGAYPPLKLDTVLASLGAQCDAAHGVHKAWFALVREQRKCVAEHCRVDG